MRFIFMCWSVRPTISALSGLLTRWPCTTVTSGLGLDEAGERACEDMACSGETVLGAGPKSDGPGESIESARERDEALEELFIFV